MVPVSRVHELGNPCDHDSYGGKSGEEPNCYEKHDQRDLQSAIPMIR